MLLSVSSDASVKLWKSFDFSSDYFESIEQCTNHCLMGSFIYKRESGLIEVPTSASWIRSHPNMLAISYRNPFFCLFDRVTVLFFHNSNIGTKPRDSERGSGLVTANGESADKQDHRAPEPSFSNNSPRKQVDQTLRPEPKYYCQ